MKLMSTRPTAELLAHVIGKQAADRLKDLSDLGQLRKIQVCELTESFGLSDCAARKVLAMSELLSRIDARPMKIGELLANSGQIAEHAKAIGMASLPVEHFRVLLLNAKNRLLDDFLCSQGILTASLVHPREVFAPAIRGRAAGVVVLHNHPSGDPEPSPEDREVTARLAAVGELVGIRVLDHVVIATGGYTSFLERGLLPA